VLNVLEGHTDWVRSVAFSNDGRQIVSGSDDKSVRVWDASTGEVLNVLEGHTAWVNSVAFSYDGRRIVSGSGDISVRVWDASTGEVLNVLEGHTAWVNSVAFSYDGRIIVSGSHDKSVRVWDASMGETVPGSGNELVLLPSYIREKTVDSTGLYTHTGWLLSPAGEGYLMFVPLDALLPDSANILTLPPSLASSVDFTGANLGPQWCSCYRSL